MKDDKKTVTRNDLCISTGAIYFARWAMTGMTEDSMASSRQRLGASPCSTWGTWCACVYKLIQPAVNICISISTANMIANTVVYLQCRQGIGTTLIWTAAPSPLKLHTSYKYTGKPNNMGQQKRRVWPADICAELNAKVISLIKQTSALA